jgi:hypothetical protein
MSSVSIKFLTVNDHEVVLDQVLSFRVEKEYYTPYTTLTAEAVYPVDKSVQFKKVELIVDGYVLHCGLPDTVIYTKKHNFYVVDVKSKSFTAMLCQNQIEEGIKSNVSLNSLIESFITIPEVEHEDDSTTVNYIYVKPTSSLWEAVVNLTHKLNNGHPYVCENNKVMVSKKSNPNTFNITRDVALSCGRGLDTTRIISDVHMKDIDGNYNKYNRTNSVAVEYNVVRHKHIDLDRQYLSNPEDALVHKLNFSLRGYNFAFASYEGYHGEDICDLVNLYDYYPNCRISKIEVVGKSGNVVTKLYTYIDGYIDRVQS